MLRKTPPIMTMMGLLDALFVDETNSRKKCACAWICMSDEINVYQHFNGGPKHLDDPHCDSASLDWDIFTDAVNASYIAGLQRGGYVSETEFGITDVGKQELMRLRAEASVTSDEAKAVQCRSQMG